MILIFFVLLIKMLFLDNFYHLNRKIMIKFFLENNYN